MVLTRYMVELRVTLARFSGPYSYKAERKFSWHSGRQPAHSEETPRLSTILPWPNAAFH